MGLRLLGMHMRIGTGMGTGRLKGTASFYVLSAKGTRKPRSVQWVFFRREVPSAPGALLVTWVELTVR
jgi:hypothetical protein